jgi:hypothetical protein
MNPDTKPMTVAELLLELLEHDGTMEVEVLLHTRDHGIVRGTLSGTVTGPATYAEHTVVRLTANDLVIQRRRDLLRRKNDKK